MILTTNDAGKESRVLFIKDIVSLRVKKEHLKVQGVCAQQVHTCCSPHVIGSTGLGIINVAFCSAHSLVE